MLARQHQASINTSGLLVAEDSDRGWLLWGSRGRHWKHCHPPSGSCAALQRSWQPLQHATEVVAATGSGRTWRPAAASQAHPRTCRPSQGPPHRTACPQRPWSSSPLPHGQWPPLPGESSEPAQESRAWPWGAPPDSAAPPPPKAWLQSCMRPEVVGMTYVTEPSRVCTPNEECEGFEEQCSCHLMVPISWSGWVHWPEGCKGPDFVSLSTGTNR